MARSGQGECMASQGKKTPPLQYDIKGKSHEAENKEPMRAVYYVKYFQCIC